MNKKQVEITKAIVIAFALALALMLSSCTEDDNNQIRIDCIAWNQAIIEQQKALWPEKQEEIDCIKLSPEDVKDVLRKWDALENLKCESE